MRRLAAVSALVVAMVHSGGVQARLGSTPNPAEESGLGASSQPSTQPLSAPADPRPAAPSPPPPQPLVPPPPAPLRPANEDERCFTHDDCLRPLWCVELRCQRTPPPGLQADKQYRLAAGKGNMQLGGTLTITPTVSVPAYGDSRTGAILSINPTFGFFVVDGLEIGFSFQAGIGIGELYEKNASTLQLGPTLRYVFNGSGPVVPYIGVLLGANLIIPENSDTIAFFDLSFRGGLLIPLNQHVAINLGIRPTVSIGVSNTEGVIFTIPIGWLGVEVFF